ncbi:MAG: hypothetical protein RL117_676 [Verrucomicrobiota bacterium]
MTNVPFVGIELPFRRGRQVMNERSHQPRLVAGAVMRMARFLGRGMIFIVLFRRGVMVSTIAMRCHAARNAE